MRIPSSWLGLPDRLYPGDEYQRVPATKAEQPGQASPGTTDAPPPDNFARVIVSQKLAAKMKKDSWMGEWIDEVELQPLPVEDRAKLIHQFASELASTQVVPIKRPPPMFPYRMRTSNQSGSVRIYLVVGTNGSVKELYASNYTHEDFARAAGLSVAGWKFKPIDRDSFVGFSIPFRLVSGK